MAKSILDKYKSIDQTKISKEAKTILLKIKVKTRNFKETTPDTNRVFNTFYSKLQESKPQAIKGYKAPTKAPSKATPKPTTKTSSKGTSAADLLKQAKKNRANQGISTSKSDIEKDAVRPAKPKGYRITDGTNYPYVKGNKYWEGRDNRLDRKQPPKKYPKLEHGGMMAKGGSFDYFDYFDDLQVHVQGVGTIYKGKSMKAAINKANSYLSKNPKAEVAIVDEKYGDEYDLEGNQIPDNMAKGGMMAKGGKTEGVKWHKYEKNVYEAELGNCDIRISPDTQKGYWSVYVKEGKKSIGQAHEVYGIDNAKDKAYSIIRSQYMADGGMMAKGGIYGNPTIFEIDEFKEKKAELEEQIKNLKFNIEEDYRDNEVSRFTKRSSNNLEELEEDYKKLLKEGIDGGMMYADGGLMAKGGSIPNNYVGKTPKEVWEMWTYKQRTHFLQDHYLTNLEKTADKKYYDEAYNTINETAYADWNNLPKSVEMAVERHIFMGQYADGGYMAKGGMVEHGLKEGDLIVFESLSEDNSIEVTNKYDGKRYIVNLNEGKREELKSKSKMAHGGTIGEPHRMEIGQ